MQWYDITATAAAQNIMTASSSARDILTASTETLEKKKRRLVAYEETFVKDDEKLALFEKCFNDKIYDIDNDLFQGWLIFKKSATGTPKEALNYVLESKVPKKIPKSKTKRKTQQPDGVNRHDPLSDEWMEIFRSRSAKEAAKDAKQATRRSGRKRGK